MHRLAKHGCGSCRGLLFSCPSFSCCPVALSSSFPASCCHRERSRSFEAVEAKTTATPSLPAHLHRQQNARQVQASGRGYSAARYSTTTPFDKGPRSAQPWSRNCPRSLSSTGEPITLPARSWRPLQACRSSSPTGSSMSTLLTWMD